MKDVIVGIDIGTSKVCTVIGKVNKANQLEILGKGVVPSTGIKKGIIVDIDSTADAVKSSVEQAESAAGVKVGSAFVNIIGMHVDVVNNRSWVNISSENREIAKKDIEKIMFAVSDIDVPEDMQIIDVTPRQYIIDGYDEIIDPVGMVGTRLELEADVILGKITSVQNIIKSVERTGLRIDGLVIEAFANAEIALTIDEKEMGTVIIDVGGGVTDVSVYQNKKLVFYDSLPVGGDHVTNDISIGLRISYSEAEKIKCQYELALASLIKNDQEISVFDTNENKKKTVKVSEVVEIIEARVYEILSLCRNLIEKAGIVGKLDSGVVLSGAGISYLDGCKQLANEVFELPVKVIPLRVGEVSKPEFAIAAGIVKCVSGSSKSSAKSSEVKAPVQKAPKKQLGLLKKISKLFNDLF